MRTRLVGLIAGLIVAGSATIAHAEDCTEVTLEQAIDSHQSGEIDEASGDSRDICKMTLVKQDIKACLTFYDPSKCTGPAGDWVKGWDALKLPTTSDYPPPLALPQLPQPTLLQLRVPFTKSAADYLAEMKSPYVSQVR